jgi:hypothetical protein
MRRLLLLTVLASMIASLGLFGQSAKSVPVICSTDRFHPHDDPDDDFALAKMLSFPQFDIRAIVLHLGHLQRKAPGDLPVKQLGHLTGRPALLLSGLQIRCAIRRTRPSISLRPARRMRFSACSDSPPAQGIEFGSEYFARRQPEPSQPSPERPSGQPAN